MVACLLYFFLDKCVRTTRFILELASAKANVWAPVFVVERACSFGTLCKKKKKKQMNEQVKNTNYCSKDNGVNCR